MFGELGGDGYNDSSSSGGEANVLAGCMMHARRPFVQALEAQDPAALFFVERFQALYRIEALAKDRQLTALRKDPRTPKKISLFNRTCGRLRVPVICQVDGRTW